MTSPGDPPTVPVWPAAAPAVPGVGPKSLEKRLDTFSIVVLVGALLGLAWVLFRLASQLLAGLMMRAYLEWLSKISPHSHVADSIGPAQRLQDAVMPYELVRTVIFGAGVGWLLWLAIRLRKKDARVLDALRTWSLAGFAGVAVTTIIECAVVLPITITYAQDMVKRMPTSPLSPAIGQMTSGITIASSLIGVVLGTAMVVAAPLTVLLWGGSIRRELAHPAGRQ